MNQDGTIARTLREACGNNARLHIAKPGFIRRHSTTVVSLIGVLALLVIATLCAVGLAIVLAHGADMVLG